MKKAFVLVILSLCLLSAQAQQVYSGADLAVQIKSGKSVVIENATVKGVLDLTPLEDNAKSAGSWSWLNVFFTSTNEVKHTIEGRLIFRNVVFQDDVLAYIHVSSNGNTYNADFAELVVFENCVFKQTAAFKYSQFAQTANFTGSVFYDEANFKYAKFKDQADFVRADFKEEANFKYAKFEGHANFQAAQFWLEANFKYTKFADGWDIRASKFNELFNVKYAEIDGKSQLKAERIGEVDAKYTKINGQSASANFWRNEQ
jgi:uncharacterized protein YjbI with pentapeptide repeats